MKVQVCLKTGRVNDSNLSEGQISELLKSRRIASAKCHGETRYYANPVAFYGVESNPALNDLFSERPNSMGYRRPDDPTALDMQCNSELEIDPLRNWKTFNLGE